MSALWTLLGIIVVLVAFVAGIYNKLVRFKNRFKNAFAQIDGARLLIAHGDAPAAEELLPLAAKWGVDMLLTGHTHTAAVRTVEGVLHVNPGSPTYSPGEERRFTCAVVEDGDVQIVELRL